MSTYYRVALFVPNPTQTNAIHAAYVQGLLEAEGIEVKILDPCFEDDPLLKAEEIIGVIRPDALGIVSDLLNPCCGVLGTKISLDLAKWVKKNYPGINIAMDGIYPTFSPRDVLEQGIDFAIQGESDLVFRDLFLALSKNDDPGKIKGLVFIEDRDMKKTPSRELIEDLDILPIPDRSSFDQKFFTQSKEIDVVSGRGCPYNCTICQPISTQIYGRKTRYRSVASVLEEVEMVLPIYYRQGRLIDFQMDTLTVNKEWVRELCREILERDLKFEWRAGTRFDKIDGELLKLMRKAGCRLIGAGLESGSRKIREDCLRKGLDNRGILESGNMIKSEGLALDTAVIVGLPGEGILDMIKTCWMILRLNPDKLFLPTALPVPGTRLYQDGVEGGLLKQHEADYFADYSLIAGEKSLYRGVTGRKIRVTRRIYSYTWKLARILRSSSIRGRGQERWQEKD